MATSWPQKRRLIGTRVQRLDGPAKATGKAKYSFDINRPGMLHAVMLRSPHAHAKIKSIDTTAAEKMPGFKVIYPIRKADEEVFYAGDEVLALAADTEEHALDAVRAVKVDYEVLDFLVREEDALQKDKNTVSPVGPRRERNNVRPPQGGKTNNFEKGMENADATVEGVYGVATICHQCLESHGLVAEWDKDGGLTVWASTQAVMGTAQALSGHFRNQKIDLPESKVKCITHYMGGGFGSKFGPDIQGIAAAELARKAGAAVKLMLDRASEITTAGNRPSAYGKVKIAGNKDGKITAYDIDCWGTPGIGNGGTVGPLPYVYPVENRRKHTILRLNTGGARAMRAPGHPQSCYLTDCALDDLAAKLGIDPMQMRLKNLPANDEAATRTAPHSLRALQNTIYTKEIQIAAEMAAWKDKWHPPGDTPGPMKRGIGMALHTWGGQASPQPNECTVLIAQDGSVTARTSSQDLGTAQRTMTAIVVAEILGLQPTDITVQLGESPFGLSSGSGGSTTCPSQAPAALRAATAVRGDLLGKVAKKLGSNVEDLVLEGGEVRDKAKDTRWPWKQVCSRLGMEQAKGVGRWTFQDSTQADNKDVSSVGVCGVQIAEVLVDTETGVVRCTQVVAVQDCGMVINKLACESQVAGGVIMGVNYALFEERIMDRVTGRQVNANMEFYKLGGLEDMPRVLVHMYDMPERGVIGIGEPPTISTHAAVGNAVFNAIGVRVPYTPFTPDRVLAALAAKGGRG
jgi:xanthine dehydrogenase YagR molybdenum-binding subunit